MKCGECKYLTGKKSTIGVECEHPDRPFVPNTSSTAKYKYKYSPACKRFEPRTEITKGEIMEQDNKIMITIPLDEYRTLIQDSEDFDIMKGILFQNAKLNYNGKELRFDDECLNEFLRFTDSRYKNILAELQEAKRMEEEKILKESEDHKNE